MFPERNSSRMFRLIRLVLLILVLLPERDTSESRPSFPPSFYWLTTICISTSGTFYRIGHTRKFVDVTTVITNFYHVGKKALIDDKGLYQWVALKDYIVAVISCKIWLTKVSVLNGFTCSLLRNFWIATLYSRQSF